MLPKDVTEIELLSVFVLWNLWIRKLTPVFFGKLQLFQIISITSLIIYFHRFSPFFIFAIPIILLLFLLPGAQIPSYSLLLTSFREIST